MLGASHANNLTSHRMKQSMPSRNCDRCAHSFPPVQHSQKFCGAKCRDAKNNDVKRPSRADHISTNGKACHYADHASATKPCDMTKRTFFVHDVDLSEHVFLCGRCFTDRSRPGDNGSARSLARAASVAVTT